MSFVRLKPGNTTLQALKTHLGASAPGPRPLHLQGLTDHWPAASLWTLNDGLASIRTAVGDQREVTVEIGKKGRGYLDPEYQRVSMGFGMSPVSSILIDRPPSYIISPFSKSQIDRPCRQYSAPCLIAQDKEGLTQRLTSPGLFLDAFILDKIPSSSPRDTIPRGYLAQSDLLDSAPRLHEHVPDLDHYSTGPRGDIFRRTIWIGPAGSWTPFHKDPYIGIYNQGKPRSFLPDRPIDTRPHTSSGTGLPIPTSLALTPIIPLSTCLELSPSVLWSSTNIPQSSVARNSTSSHLQLNVYSPYPPPLDSKTPRPSQYLSQP